MGLAAAVGALAAAPTHTILPLPRRVPPVSAPALPVVYAPSPLCRPLRQRPQAPARSTVAQANVQPPPSTAHVPHPARPSRQTRRSPSPFPFPGATPAVPARVQELPTVSSFVGRVDHLVPLRSAWPASARCSSPVDRNCRSRCSRRRSRRCRRRSFVQLHSVFLSPGPDH